MDAPICPFSLEKNKSTYVVCLAEGYTEVEFFTKLYAVQRELQVALVSMEVPGVEVTVRR